MTDKPTGPTLLLLLRANQESAKRRVLAALRANGGHVQRAAAELGLLPRSLYKAVARDAELSERFFAVAQGLEGSRRVAVESRRNRAAAKKSTGVKKKSSRVT